MDINADKKFAAGLSITSNALIIATKIVAGMASGSISIISEAIHSLSDFLASVLTFFAVTRSAEPADKNHPFGHGKYEDMSGFIEGGLIIHGLDEHLKRVKRYVPSNYPIPKKDYINGWKLFVARNQGSGLFGETMCARRHGYILNMSSVVIYKVRASSVSSYQINSEPNRTTQHNKIEGIVRSIEHKINLWMEQKTYIKLKCQTEKYVTFEYSSFSYEGGAHGFGQTICATFRKDDGRKFGWDMFSSYDGLQPAIKQGLKRYFQVSTDQELEEHLQLPDGNTINSFPMPSTDPWLTPDGLTMHYGAYEIASYAEGEPTFTVPFSQIKNCLTVTAAKLISE